MILDPGLGLSHSITLSCQGTAAVRLQGAIMAEIGHKGVNALHL